MPDDDDIELVGEDNTVQAAVALAIKKMLVMLEAGEFKMTVGEFTRLIEFQKQISVDNIGHVKVTWITPFDETEYSSET